MVFFEDGTIACSDVSLHYVTGSVGGTVGLQSPTGYISLVDPAPEQLFVKWRHCSLYSSNTEKLWMCD